jgi:hypothetical protein
METINSTFDYQAIVAELGEAVVEAVKAELGATHSFTSRYELTEQLIEDSQYCVYTAYYGDILLFSANADHALEEGLVDITGHTAASLMGAMAYWALVVDVNNWLVANHADLTI